jgi:hypothetical protein
MEQRHAAREERMRQMRNMGIAVIAMGAMLAVPAAGLAATAATPGQTATAPKTLKPAKTAKAAAATHSVRGVVKSVDANTLVVERAGKNKKELTFALDSSTHRSGDIAVGSTVSVRYTGDASKMMATNIQPVKAKAKTKTKAGKAAAH